MSPVSSSNDLTKQREAVVLRHVAAENERDLEGIMATFAHPRYEIVPSATVYEGDAEVRQMILEQWERLPRMHYSAEAVFHAANGVFVETRTTCPGTAVDMLSVNLFVFRQDKLILERCYFDRMQFAAELEKIEQLHD